MVGWGRVGLAFDGEMLTSSRISYLSPRFLSTALNSVARYLNNGGTTIQCSSSRVDSRCSPSSHFKGSNVISKQKEICSSGHGFYSFSTGSSVASVLVQARDPGKLCEELENAIQEGRLTDAWNLNDQHMHMEGGFPRKSLVNKLILTLAGSFDAQWVEKAYDLFVKASEDEEKLNLFEKETLIYLSLTLAITGMPIPASTILRKLIEVTEYPPVNAWSAILGYMSQTSAKGAYLAAELVIEIGYLFQDGRIDVRKKSNAPLISMKPDTTAFNIALAGCLLFGTTRKAEQLLDMMPRIGLKADTTSLIIMAHVYERNGRRDELKKLKRQIDESFHTLGDVQFRQFYNCLLSSYLKLGDLEATSHMVLEMLRKGRKAQNVMGVSKLLCEKTEGSPCSSHGEGPFFFTRRPPRPFISYEDLRFDRKFLKLKAMSEELLDSLIVKLQGQVELITTERGILQPTQILYVKLVKTYLEIGKIKELAEFLIDSEKEDSPVSSDNSMLVHVINACISLGWLDHAHDMLDEMRLAGIRTGSSVYSNLLKAYCKADQAGEITALLRDVRKAGIQLDSSCYEAMIESRVVRNDTYGALSLFKEMKVNRITNKDNNNHQEKLETSSSEPGLMTELLHEIKEGQKADCGVHDWNNMIHFFCKKRLMQDAENALKKMRSLGHYPNAGTFYSLVMGYASIGGKYTEVAELWGQMKSIALASGMKFDQELLDALLYTFVRGGFFVRGNEVIEMMEKGNMFIDKYKYRSLFLKYHRTLCKGKAPKFQTEAQMNKREALLVFKKWAGLS